MKECRVCVIAECAYYQWNFQFAGTLTRMTMTSNMNAGWTKIGTASFDTLGLLC